jgi:uncharacterized beta-barrel protein YwiB (DUF1934 family)
MELFKDEPSLQQQSENVISFELEVQTHKVKVFVMIEKRRGSRVSFTKKGIVIRLSQSLTQQQKQEQSAAFLSWAKNKIAKHPELITQYNFGKTYQDGDWLKLYDENFLIKVQSNQTKFATVKVRDGELVLIFPVNS